MKGGIEGWGEIGSQRKQRVLKTISKDKTWMAKKRGKKRGGGS